MIAAWGSWSQIEAVIMFHYFYLPDNNHKYMIDDDQNEPRLSHYQL